MTDPLAPIFHDLTPRQIEQALDCFSRRIEPAGTSILLEGELGGTLLVVADGEIEIRTGDLELGVARAGDLLGEIGLFSHGLRTATAEANTEVDLLELSPDGYRELVARGNPVAYRLEHAALQALVERLRSIDYRISRAAAGTPVEHHHPSPSFFQRVGALFGFGGAVAAPALDIVEALGQSRLFDGFPPEVRIGLAPSFKVEAWAGGQFLCTEGEPGESLFIVVSGAVDVLVETEAERVEPVAVLGPGEAFGMAGVVDLRPRTASVITHGPTVTLRLDRQDWARLSESDTALGRALRVAMIRSLAESLAFANAQLALLDLNAQITDLTPLMIASAAIEAFPEPAGA